MTPKERTATEDGARFVSTFTKSRNSRNWPTPLDWHVSEDEDGVFQIQYEAAGTEELVYQCIKDGLDRCSDIAAELDISKGTVSKTGKQVRIERTNLHHWEGQSGEILRQLRETNDNDSFPSFRALFLSSFP